MRPIKILSVIKNEGGNDNIVWKCPEEDFYINSVLIVNDSEEAVFVRNGVIVQIFKGGKYKLTTSNYPFISKLRNNLLFGGKEPFNCKVYFVNKAHKLELLWGTPTPIQVRDAEFGFMVSVRASGSYSVKITNPAKLLVKLLGMNIATFGQDDIEDLFFSPFVMAVKNNLAKMMKEAKMTILDMASEYDTLAENIKPNLQQVLNEYGIGLVNFYIVDISIPENDPNYEKINNAYAEKGTVNIQGADWDRITQKELLKDAISNQGASNIGAGIGLGLGAMGAIGNMAGSAFNKQAPIQQEPVQQKASNEGFKFCSECGTKNQSNAKFCSGCGHKFELGVCPNCGATLKAGAKFCSECGEKL